MGRGDGVVESVEQMLRSAIYGRDLLDAAAQRSASEASLAATAAAEHPAEGSDAGAGNSRQLSISVRLSPLTTPPVHIYPSQRPDQPVEGGQTCLGCNATSTPEWRRGPLGVYHSAALAARAHCSQVRERCVTLVDWSMPS